MTTLDLKNSVLEYVNNADDRLLKMIKAIAETYQSEEDFTLSKKQYEILDQRRTLHESGKSKSYSWQEIKTSINNSSS
ncbi:putative addiction module component [Nonlabens dokdonensis]|uniref:Addiction module protein n=2 Tax=Nonlabens dokdonensis TaxID=328515 RepID=L7WCA4_NONDD|nr:addiction module protein [Nonlabens dokdonensis]AGC77822.1 hypothetical protein DDD_2695 [Nonlabens dokdonensis DSW-6]PZX39646.1 putative addiction module component [Nonlabens dokdonensis]